jgi:cytochrome o ubiquinol oxidase subunit 1
VLLAVPGADFLLHNSLFLIAHFHNTIIGGTVFGLFAGFAYWFPKVTGFKLDERLGKGAFWCWLIGFYLAFLPLYVLGFMGMTRRLNHYDNPAFRPWLLIAAAGALVILAGILFQVAQIVTSIRQRRRNPDLTGDPWDGRTLEWSIPSPAPFYNFAQIPVVSERDAFWAMKQNGASNHKPKTYHPISMPKNTGAGVFIAAFALALGFGMVWHIWWMAALGLAGVIAALIVRTSADEGEHRITAEEVRRTEERRVSEPAGKA